MLALWLQILLLFSHSAAPQNRPVGSHLAPTPMEVTDVPFPTTGPPVAIVRLVATVELDGRVSEVQVVDSNGSASDGARYKGTLVGYVEDSTAAVKQWRFDPAIDASLKPARSLASITFFYDRVFDAATLPAMKGIPPESASGLDAFGEFDRAHTILHYLPALALRLSRADYLNSFTPHGNGVAVRNLIETVVLNVHIGANGSVSDADVVKSAQGPTAPDQSLDEPTVRASENWKFRPASLDGKPLQSTATVAFVFWQGCDGSPRRSGPGSCVLIQPKSRGSME